MKCEYCGKEHPDDTVFCPYTGQKISTIHTCSNPDCDFRSQLPYTAIFCPSCGNILNAQRNNHCNKPFTSEYVYDEIGEFHEGLAEVKRNMKCGFINDKGQEIIPCEYDGFYGSFKKGYCVVIKDSYDDTYWGVIDKDNKVIIQLLYDDISYDDDIEAFIVRRKNKFWGIISPTGKELVPFRWDYISWFTNGFALAKNSHNIVLIDKYGKTVYRIPSQYEDAEAISDQLIAVKRNGRWGVIDRKEQVIIDFLYDEIRAGFPHIIVSQDGEEGLYSIEGKQLLPCRYYRIFPSEDRAMVYEDPDYGHIINYKNESLSSYYPHWYFGDGKYWPVVDDTGSALLLNWDGDEVIPPTQYKRMACPINGLILVTYHDDEEASYFEDDDDFDPDDYDFRGVVNLEGKILIPYMYESIDIGDNSLITVKFQGRYCIVDQNNEMIFPNGIDMNEWEHQKSSLDYLLEE